MERVRKLVAASIASASILALAACSPSVAPTGTAPAVAPATNIYVVSYSTPAQILSFPVGSTGNPSPSNTITIPGLVPGEYIVTDPTGNLYVCTSNGILEYTASATGLATPIRDIPIDSTTTIGVLSELAVDATGDIYVSQFNNPSIEIFSSTANGSVAPSRTIAGSLTGLADPYQIALDSAGNLYVANLSLNLAVPSSILVFGPGANGNVAPIRVLNVAGDGLAIDTSNNLYVMTLTNEIAVYAAGASGSAAPIRTITSEATGYAALSWGIAVDPAGNIYVSSQGSLLNNVIPPNPTILQFSPSASGNTPFVSSFTPTSWIPLIPTGPSFDEIAVH